VSPAFDELRVDTLDLAIAVRHLATFAYAVQPSLHTHTANVTFWKGFTSRGRIADKIATKFALTPAVRESHGHLL
jgi:hypothetical protein